MLDEIRFIKPRLGRWAARHPKPMHYLLQPAVGWTVAEPKGVALIISPWNYPVLLSFEPMADAIAAGNCVCMKPSELSPHTSGVMADLIARYMDPQAFRVVQGGPQETTKLLEQPFNHIFYTGGGKVGSIVMAAAAKHLTPVTLELGGKSPVFVDRTANLDVAARRIAWGRFINAGQTCVCANRLYVQDGVYDRFAEKLQQAVSKLHIGDGLDKGVTIGPLIDEKAVAKVEEHIADALEKGARVVCGGKADERGGSFFQPTILVDVPANAKVSKEETFGPLAPLFRFKDEADVIAQANDTEFGLAAYFYARDLSRVFRVGEALEYGIVGINTGIISNEVARSAASKPRVWVVKVRSMASKIT